MVQEVELKTGSDFRDKVFCRIKEIAGKNDIVRFSSTYDMPGYSQPYTSLALSDLVAEGKIVKVSRGVYRIVSFVSPVVNCSSTLNAEQFVSEVQKLISENSELKATIKKLKPLISSLVEIASGL